ncbi:MAG: peptidoglycan-binding protein [Clostridia bacterium]|nr:peptidoglycan-binding protein [Clostridia bacterium]
MAEFTIPEFITVHIGAPSNSGQNITIPFADYIKNVASSEIYPTWPENAIRANIYAQITYALNRVFTEYYRSRGYDFDITNNTAYDQFFVPNRDIFSNISNIVDDIFNSYIQRFGTVGPIFSQYCNGTTVTCEGLSQWGTVPLAQSGYTPFSILQNYYGNDIGLVDNAPVAPNVPSYGNIPIQFGDRSEAVVAIQSRLNEVASNYPSIPKIYPVDGVFGENTRSAVTQFQRIFSLTPDGIVGSATWYRLISISNAVRRLSELDSKGLTQTEFSQQFPDVLREGDAGRTIEVLQYYLGVVGSYYDEIPIIEQTGVFDAQTKNAIIAFQKAFSLTPDGIVGEQTWQELYRAFLGVEPFFKNDADTSKANEGQFSGYTLRNEG